MPTRRPREWVPEWAEEEGRWAEWRRRVPFMLLSARARHLERISPNQIHVFRMEGGRLTPWPTLPRDWLARDGREGPEEPAGARERDWPRGPLVFDWPGRRVPTLPTNNPFNELEAGGGGERGAGMGAAGAGAAVLALAALLLLVRAIERCLFRSVCKPLRRRGSDEWFTPHVLATSGQTGDEESEPSGGSSEFPPEAPSDEPPPPYSACAPAGPKRPAPAPAPRDEPPPPYSARYVAYSDPKDGQPTVHFYNGQRQMFDNRPSLAPETGQSLAPGTGQTLAPETGQTLAPETGQTLAPGTAQALAPGTGQTLAPGTGQTLSPGTGQTLAPGMDQTSAPGTGQNLDTSGTSLVAYGGATESQDAPMAAGESSECRNRGVSASEATSPISITVA